MIIDVTIENGKTVWLNTDKIILFYRYESDPNNPSVTIIDYETGDGIQLLTIVEEAKWLQQRINDEILSRYRV